MLFFLPSYLSIPFRPVPLYRSLVILPLLSAMIFSKRAKLLHRFATQLELQLLRTQIHLNVPNNLDQLRRIDSVSLTLAWVSLKPP